MDIKQDSDSGFRKSKRARISSPTDELAAKAAVIEKVATKAAVIEKVATFIAPHERYLFPRRHPAYDPSVLTKVPDYGILKSLEGTWVNFETEGKMNYGILTMCMPSPGSNSGTIPGLFHFLCENYTEELTFTPVADGVRNRAGTNEMIIGAMKYETSIISDAGVALHAENGMYLWMQNMYNHKADPQSIDDDNGWPQLKSGTQGPVWVPNYTIARLGTIPHGTSITLIGNQSSADPVPGPSTWPEGYDTWTQDGDHLAISPTMGFRNVSEEGPINLDAPAPAWVSENLKFKEPNSGRRYIQRILAHELYPYSVRPEMRLRDTVKNQTIKSYQLIELDSSSNNNGQGGYQGGITNIPILQKYARVRKMRHRLWLETVEETDQDGNVSEIQQLQYEQTIFVAFMFGSDGGQTIWPHITVNTLRKKEDTTL